MTTDNKPRIEKLIVDRATWHRGIGPIPVPSALLTEIGTQCCLGFLASAVGYEDKALQGALSPSDLLRGRPDLFPTGVCKSWRGVRSVNSEWTDKAMTLNDTLEFNGNEPARERAIADHFKQIGVEVVFVGETSAEINRLQQETVEFYNKVEGAG